MLLLCVSLVSLIVLVLSRPRVSGRLMKNADGSWSDAAARDKVTISCKVCDRGALIHRRTYRMSAPVVFIGYVLITPAIAVIFVAAVFAVLSALIGGAIVGSSNTELLALKGTALAFLGTGYALIVAIFAMVAALLGWLLIMKKTVLQCTTCGAIIDANLPKGSSRTPGQIIIDVLTLCAAAFVIAAFIAQFSNKKQVDESPAIARGDTRNPELPETTPAIAVQPSEPVEAPAVERVPATTHPVELAATPASTPEETAPLPSPETSSPPTPQPSVESASPPPTSPSEPCSNPEVLYKPDLPRSNGPRAQFRFSGLIGIDGSITDVRLESSSSLLPLSPAWSQWYEQTARQNLSRWRMRPLVCGGDATAVRKTFDFGF